MAHLSIAYGSSSLKLNQLNYMDIYGLWGTTL